jgi:hypothetical protein
MGGDDLGGDSSELYGEEGEELYSVPGDDGAIYKGMMDWVDAVIADLGICPFTVDAKRAGGPLG